jgi:hypothetical protein
MQSNATSNNPCTGFTNNDRGGVAGDSMHDGNNVDVVEYGAACAVAVLSFFIGVLVHQGAVLRAAPL